MKAQYYFILLFFIICSMQMNAQESPKLLDTRVSIEIEKQKVEDVLKSIEQISDLKISYSSSVIDSSQTVSLNIKERPVREILDSIFSPNDFQYKIINNRILIFKKKNGAKKKYTLSGYIKEEESQELLLGVTIYIPELGIGTTSNYYGFYSLTVPEGFYEFEISYIGYGTLKKEIDINDNHQLDIYLKPKIEELEEIILENDDHLNQSKANQMSSEKVTPSQVEDLPAILGEKNALKTLQLLPGIQGGLEGSSGLYVRGGTPDQNLIILDDAPVYNANHLFGFFSVFHGDALKSFEVYKGGFPSRFGGRISSVLKIDMKDGNKEKFQGKASIGLISSSLQLEGPLKKNKTSFLVTARRTYADLIARQFMDKKDGGVGGYYFTDINLKLNHVLNKKNKIFWSNYFGRDHFFADYDDSDFYENDKYKASLKWGNMTSTLRWNHQFNKKLFANTSLIYSNYLFKIKSETTEYGVSRKTNMNNGLNDYSLKIDFDYYPNNQHTVKYGLVTTLHNFRPYEYVQEGDGLSKVELKETSKSIESAVYFEDNWKLSNKFSINTGLRFSHFKQKTKDYLNVEPRISLAWNVKDDIALKTSYSRMNQNIHLISNSGFGLPTDLWVSSTDLVRPQRSDQFALGFVKDFFDKGYSISLETYYKKMNNILTYKEGTSFFDPILVEFDQNDVTWEDKVTSGKGWAYGTEILLRKQTGKFTGWLGYTLAWAKRQFDEVNLGEEFLARYDRRHDVSIVGIYKPSKKTTWSATWVFGTGNNFTIENYRTYLPPTTTIEENLQQASIISYAKERNNFKGESMHRLDVSVQFNKITKRKRERTWSFSVYNIYAKNNPFVYIADDYDDYNNFFNTAVQNNSKVLTKVSVFVLIPSINYTLKF